MRVVVLTQDDRMFIPSNVKKLMTVADVIEIVVINSPGSLINKRRQMLAWFGLSQCLKMGMRVILLHVIDLADRLSGWRLRGGTGSLRSLAARYRIPYRVIGNVNAPEFIDHVRMLNPDLMVSYSAPQIVRDPLLSTPRHGIVNVHGSLLPDFKGLLPSFWVLYEGETETGATVHFMSKGIDEGKIIAQGRLRIPPGATMYDVMAATKRLGGELMVEAVRRIGEGSVPEYIPLGRKSRYYTWPTANQAKIFRKRGHRLI